ncbi:mask, partial [Symbiodinium pilosum]
PFARMLRIWRMSGQELPAVSIEGISVVRDLKASLCSLHGFPLCMQQLLHNGNGLDDSTKLDAPIDLQLVLLALSTKAQQCEAANELCESCLKGDLNIVRLLLEAGANKNATDPENRTALMLAAETGHLEITRLLLEAGADKDLKTALCTTALMVAAQKGHVEIARLLLDAGANKDLPGGCWGYTALMMA